MKTIIDYNDFLSLRFDLVIRYYLLEQAGFDVRKARTLSTEDKYLKKIYKELLKTDVKTNPHSLKKTRGISNEKYGDLVAEKLFYHWGSKNRGDSWLWMEKQTNENWINWITENPYLIQTDGIGTSVKRFSTALIHEKPLYWKLIPKGEKKQLLALWDERQYKETMKPTKYEKIKESKKRMIDRMKNLDFFSRSTYIGEEDLITEYILNRRTGT